MTGSSFGEGAVAQCINDGRLPIVLYQIVAIEKGAFKEAL